MNKSDRAAYLCAQVLVIRDEAGYGLRRKAIRRALLIDRSSGLLHELPTTYIFRQLGQKALNTHVGTLYDLAFYVQWCALQRKRNPKWQLPEERVRAGKPALTEREVSNLGNWCQSMAKELVKVYGRESTNLRVLSPEKSADSTTTNRRLTTICNYLCWLIRDMIEGTLELEDKELAKSARYQDGLRLAFASEINTSKKPAPWPAAIHCKPETRYVTVGEVEQAAANAGFHTTFPATVARGNYITAQTASKYMTGGALLKQAFLRTLTKSGRTAVKAIRTSDLRDYLLSDFKRRGRFPHWPYTGKERYLKVNEALLVSYQADFDRDQSSAENKDVWWRPGLVTAAFLNRWINTGAEGTPPILFKALSIRLKNGKFPALTLQATRRYHHTAALLAGAQEVFIDELAGRKSGRQSDHYDLRTPHEILAESIATFDPDAEFDVIGPIAEQAAKIKLADRKAFLYENAAPKHLTEIGGCATDWSLDPCKQYGDCTRCDQQLWRKGDQARLIQIQKRRAYAIEMIGVAEQKMLTYDEVPRSLRLQHQQFKDDLARCDAILSIEEDEAIRTGTIVTFSPAPGSMTVSRRTSVLRQQSNDPAVKG